MNGAWKKLVDYISRLESVVVAFSGGSDSSLLVFAAKEALGRNVLAATADSPLLPSVDREAAASFCEEHGVRHVFVKTHEMEDLNFLSNPHNRCYFCKKALYRALGELAAREGYYYILEGTNITELGLDRPGFLASKEFSNVRVPYVELGMSEEEIRSMLRWRGLLSVAQKPSSACLASRIPANTKITPEVLKRVDEAESVVRSLGFAQVRVRDHGDIARIEVEQVRLNELVDKREEIIQKLKEKGYKHIVVDLQGYKKGGANS